MCKHHKGHQIERLLEGRVRRFCFKSNRTIIHNELVSYLMNTVHDQIFSLTNINLKKKKKKYDERQVQRSLRARA